MHAMSLGRTRIRIPIQSISQIASIAIVLMFGFVILGIPKIGVGLIMPWVSIFLVRRPGVLLAAYLYIPFYKSALLGYTPIDLTVWLALICILAFLFHVVKRQRVLVTVMSPLWFIFCGVLIIATFFSVDPRHSFVVSVETLALTFLPLMLVFVVAGDRNFLHQFLLFTFGASIVFSIYGAWSLLISNSSRLELTSNAIGTGRFALLATLLAPTVVRRTVWKPLILFVVIMLGMLVSLASGSRGPLAAAAVSGIAIYAVWTKWFALRLLGFMSAGILAVVVLFSGWIENFISEGSLWRIRILIESAFGAGELDNSSAARVSLYEQAIVMWSQQPIIGRGPGSFEIVSGSLAYPHNALLQAGAELGVVGFYVVSLLFLCAVVNSYRQLHDPTVRGVAILMLFAVVSAMVSNNLYDNRWMWGMVLMAGSIIEETRLSNIIHREQPHILDENMHA